MRRSLLRQARQLSLACHIVLLLSACATFTDSSDQSGGINDSAVMDQRSAELSKIESFYLSARVSVKASGEAWTGVLRWQQAPGSYRINFNSPMGQGALLLEGTKDHVELSLADGSSQTATDADRLLYQQTGLEFPINGLRYWIMGIPQPDVEQPDEMLLDKQGLMATLDQSQWFIQYKGYQDIDRQGLDHIRLPKKMVMSNDGVTIRIVVDQWQLEA